MKRIISVMILILMTVSFLLPIFNVESCAMEEKIEKANEEIHTEITDTTEEVSARELSIIYMNKEMDAIEHLKETDKMEWYKNYRKIVCKYKYVIGAPDCIFDVYTEEEINLICRAVETECYGRDFESKVMVANVIFNRIESDIYSSDVKTVITSPNQFAYFREVIPEDTLYAVLYAYEIEDLTNGSLSFHSNEKTEKFGGRSYVFTDTNSGHHFYR